MDRRGCILLYALVTAAATSGCHGPALPLGDSDSVAQPHRWRFEVVDTPGTRASEFGPLGNSTSLAVDDGGAYIAYGGDLHLATRDASAWTLRVLPSTGTADDGFESSVASSPSTGPVIAAADRNGPSHVSLVADGIDHPLPVPGGTVLVDALVLDANGEPHVAFVRSDLGVNYATWNGATWRVEPVAPNATVALGLAIAIDGAGRPAIAFADTSMRVALRADDGTWSIETVASSPQRDVMSPSLAVDSTGALHLGYLFATPTLTLQHAVREHGRWQIETVDALHETIYAALALDAADVPHFVLARRAIDPTTATAIPAAIAHAVRGAQGWSLETIRDDQSPTYPSIALTSDGNIHASWFDVASGSVMYGYTAE